MSIYVGDAPATLNNYTATTDPTATDDEAAGYTVGSYWMNTVTNDTFRCINNTTGMAVWINTSLTVEDLGDLAVQDKTDIIDDTAYGAIWNTDLDAPTKNSVYDKINTLDAQHEIIANSASANPETISVQSDSKTRIGDGDGSDYTEIEADGTIKFIGNSTIFDDIVTSFDPAKVPPVNAPTWSNFIGNLKAYTFDINDFLTITAELLHGYKNGSAIEIHIHWATNGTEAVNKAVKWEVEYTISESDPIDGTGGIFPTTTVASKETVISAFTPDLIHMYTSIVTVPDATIRIGSIIKIRVRRIAASGTAPASDPFGLNLGIHYEMDTIGSRQRLIK